VTTRRRDTRVALLRAGVLAAGLGAALAVGPAVASADDGRDRDTVTAGRESTATARPHSMPRRGVTPPADSRNRPAASAVTSRAGTRVMPADVLETTAPQPVSSSDRAPQPAAPPAQAGAVTAPATVPAAPATVPAAPATGAQRALAAAAPGPIQSAVLAAQAYIYGYPLMEYQRVRQTVGTVNTVYSLTSFANPDIDPIWLSIGGGKLPNVDTFYSLAELDLSQGPVVLSIPDMGSRYFSFQLTDPYTNVSTYIGSRATGSGPAKYAITWAGGPTADIPGAQTVVVPYSSMLALGRTLAGDAADQLQAIELMNQYTLNPTGGAVSPVVAIPKPGVGYLDAISAAMEFNPPPAVDGPQLAAMAKIGVGPGLRVADAELSALSMFAADLAVRTTAALLPLLTTLNQYAAALQNRGWATPDAAIGNYGTNYLLRAGVTEAGLLANTPEEAVYSAGLLGAHLLPLADVGTGSYVLHFGPGEESPVGAFWSVTVYDSAGRLVPNAQQRYSVSSSRPDELVRRPDGSIDIIFASHDPGDPGANWLKVPPGGGFNAYLRMYGPEQPILDGTWTAPAITRRW
jgi:hypothetical protein